MSSEIIDRNYAGEGIYRENILDHYSHPRNFGKMEKFDVALATDGEKGWKTINEKRPDLVLLDIILPKMDGFEILRRIKFPRIDELENEIVLFLERQT